MSRLALIATAAAALFVGCTASTVQGTTTTKKTTATVSKSSSDATAEKQQGVNSTPASNDSGKPKPKAGDVSNPTTK